MRTALRPLSPPCTSPACFNRTSGSSTSERVAVLEMMQAPSAFSPYSRTTSAAASSTPSSRMVSSL